MILCIYRTPPAPTDTRQGHCLFTASTHRWCARVHTHTQRHNMEQTRYVKQQQEVASTRMMRKKSLGNLVNVYKGGSARCIQPGYVVSTQIMLTERHIEFVSL